MALCFTPVIDLRNSKIVIVNCSLSRTLVNTISIWSHNIMVNLLILDINEPHGVATAILEIDLNTDDVRYSLKPSSSPQVARSSSEGLLFDKNVHTALNLVNCKPIEFAMLSRQW